MAQVVIEGENMTIDMTHKYQNGRVAVQVCCEDGDDFLTLSVNMPDIPLKDNEFIVKTYSENEPYIETLFETGLFEYTGRCVGFTNSPVWRIKQ